MIAVLCYSLGMLFTTVGTVNIDPILANSIRVPVATVALNGAQNAGILAAQILGTENSNIQRNLSEYKLKLKEKVDQSNKDL